MLDAVIIMWSRNSRNSFLITHIRADNVVTLGAQNSSLRQIKSGWFTSTLFAETMHLNWLIVPLWQSCVRYKWLFQSTLEAAFRVAFTRRSIVISPLRSTLIQTAGSQVRANPCLHLIFVLPINTHSRIYGSGSRRQSCLVCNVNRHCWSTG